MIGFTTGEEQEEQSAKKHTNTNTNLSILDLYPEYNFVIASTLYKNKYKFWNWIMIPFNLIWIIVAIVLYLDHGRFNNDDLIAIHILIALTFVIDCIRKIYVIKKRKTLKQLYYIQNYSLSKQKKLRYCFFVDSNKKWGLLKRKSLKITIPAMYDEMEWKETERFVIAIKKGERIILDTNNQTCI